MSTFTIKEGAHYHAVFPLSTYPWIGQQSMSRYVRFDASCQYNSAAYNAQDVNKLFGLSFGLFAIHKNSARFGWYYNPDDDCIDLVAYVYNDGVRNQDAQLRFPVVAQVQLGEQVCCHIEATYDHESGIPVYEFSTTASKQRVNSKDVLRPNSLPPFGLTHGPYFGGELTAPHTMKIELSRKPLSQ